MAGLLHTEFLQSFDTIVRHWNVEPGSQRHAELKVIYLAGLLNAAGMIGTVSKMADGSLITGMSNAGRVDVAISALERIIKSRSRL